MNCKLPSVAQMSPVVPGPTPEKDWFEESLQFLDRVRKRFSKKKHVYNSYVAIMRDYNNKMIGTPQMITYICEMLRDHVDLLLDFNAIIPSEFAIYVTSDRRSGETKVGFLGPMGFQMLGTV